MPSDILDPPKPAAPSATPSFSPAPNPSPAAGVTPAAASPLPAPASGDANPYSEVDAAFTKAGIADALSKPRDVPLTKDGKTAAAPAKPIPTAADKAPGVPKELRQELDRVKGELKTKSESYAALEAKIADFESKGKDTGALTERLTTLEKQMEAKDAEIRALKQEASPEFQKKYDEPFNRMADRAKEVVEQIKIEDDETGAVKAATWAEFTKLYNLGEFIATKEAKRQFGEDGGSVIMRYYTELHRLADDRHIALDEEKKHWKEKDIAEQAKRVQGQQEINAFWTKSNADLAEKIEDYHDSPEDKEFVDVRQKALAAFDAAPKTLKERIIKDAHNRQRVAAFPVLRMRLIQALKEVADLKSENDGLKERPPGKTTRPGGEGGPKAEESFEDYIRKSVQ